MEKGIRANADVHSCRGSVLRCPLQPYLAHIEQHGRNEEIECAEARISGNIGDRRRLRHLRLGDEKCAGNGGLTTAEDHCPLAAVCLPAPDGGRKLQDTREDRPQTEGAENPVHAHGKGDDHRDGHQTADDDIDRLAPIVCQSTVARCIVSGQPMAWDLKFQGMSASISDTGQP